jgi:prephenate dehydrogenase
MRSKRPTVAIIGLGLLGGSLALALKRRKSVHLVGWSPSPRTRRMARQILTVSPDLVTTVRNADVVILGSPSSAVAGLLERILPHLKKDALVMDVASVKEAIVTQTRSIPGAAQHFVPCHPMAGSEKTGVAHADPRLYEGRTILVTPLPGNSSSLVRRAMGFWKGLDAIVHRVDPGSHDRWVAVTSHLPHLVACSLVENYESARRREPQIARAVGRGFRDVTRIAASGSDMWVDIVTMNTAEILKNIGVLRHRLDILDGMLKNGSRAKWKRFFESAARSRMRL